MANAAQGDVILVTFVGQIYQQRTMLTLPYAIFSITGTHNILDVQDALLAALKAGGAEDFETAYAACLTDGWASEEIWAQRIYPTRARRNQTPGTLDGTLGAGVVSNVAAVIEMWTEKAGRDQIANKHIGPMDPGDPSASSGRWTNVALSPLGLLRDAILEPVTILAGAVDLLPCIYHKASVSPKFDYLVAGTVHDTTRTQRTRTIGKGV